MLPYVDPKLTLCGRRGDDGWVGGWGGTITFDYQPKASGKDTGWPSWAGARIVHSPAIAFNGRACTGGVAILFPPGWLVIEEVELAKGRGVASLVQDRTCKFYVVSGYIHPDNRNGDTEALLRAWRFMDKKTDYAFVAGDFNGLDKHLPQLWEKFLLQFQCSDVHPELATYRHSRGVSCLDRGLVPDSLINSAKLYASERLSLNLSCGQWA